ncbi:hypothetical protein DMS64_14115 [Klebsiella variicola]|nr:hypothetical protein DMS64_14115 [Klebsiella variicola]
MALRLPDLRSVRPAFNLFTMLAETADAGGLNIAETFPEGRGSPHGCGLRAVFCKDAASARPEACRDKSKAPRSGDVAGRSPGVQGAAATGRPLCAPCAMRDITQKKYWERNVSELTQSTYFPRPKPLQTDNSIYGPNVAPVSAAPPGRLTLLFSGHLQRGFTHPRVPHHRQQPQPDQPG